MPIRPENRGRYPANWKAIRERILRRALWRCEWPGCNPARRMPHGRWFSVCLDCDRLLMDPGPSAMPDPGPRPPAPPAPPPRKP